MDLAVLQTKLLGLIKSTYEVTDEDELYIKAVAGSDHLTMVRDVVLWWRGFGVERFCVLTSTFLKNRGLFAEAISAFVRQRAISPFVEELGPSFLEEMTKHQDDCVVSLAQFELALIKVKKGDPHTYAIEWRVDPNAVLSSILKGVPLNEDDIKGHYRTVVSRSIPNMFDVLDLGGLVPGGGR